MGLLAVCDAIFNRVLKNWAAGKKTHVFIDEFHVMFNNPHSAEFFDDIWRRFRKRGGLPCAITQNVEYLLASTQASTMLSNSEFVVVLKQGSRDRAALADLLGMSTEQQEYITNPDAGSGVIQYGGRIVPFENRYPNDGEMYRLMTTKPSDDAAWREGAA
jgi:type IV secretory pathway VirB4 component